MDKDMESANFKPSVSALKKDRYMRATGSCLYKQVLFTLFANMNKRDPLTRKITSWIAAAHECDRHLNALHQ